LPVIPYADFLAGALLTLLLPVALLIALVVWYWWFSMRVPETADGQATAKDPGAATPAPSIPESLPPEPGT
jgi:hypothetical protein